MSNKNNNNTLSNVHCFPIWIGLPFADSVLVCAVAVVCSLCHVIIICTLASDYGLASNSLFSCAGYGRVVCNQTCK